jgi:putative transposase
MNLHLAEIAKAVAPSSHAVLLVDQAGWHLSTRLVVPANITIIPLPPKCPELNPVENVWQFLRDNWLSNRIFKSYDSRRPWLCGLEQARRSALAHNVHRTAPMGARVLIIGIWYY